MAEQRIFIYSGNIDDAFKAAAKKSLIDAQWMPLCEIVQPAQVLICSGADRSTCIPQQGAWPYQYAIVAQRS